MSCTVGEKSDCVDVDPEAKSRVNIGVRGFEEKCTWHLSTGKPMNDLFVERLKGTTDRLSSVVGWQ